MNDQEKLLLVVEDNEELRFLVKMQLKKVGCLADFAINGREALDKMAENNYEIILMDVMMPIMDGLEATKIIREREAKENKEPTTIIAMTALSDKKSCLEAGMNDFLFKPVMLNQLISILKQWLPQKELGTEPII
jgi:CheY-like chemotaxis protein